MLYSTLGNVRFAKLLILLSFGGARRNRTDDLFNAIEALSQLSYGPTFSARDHNPEPKVLSDPFGEDRLRCWRTRATEGRIDGTKPLHNP